MWSRVDWHWVGEWCRRVFLAAFPLGIFLYLSASPVMRPGGAIAALWPAVMVGGGLAVVVTLVTAIVLAIKSAREND